MGEGITIFTWDATYARTPQRVGGSKGLRGGGSGVLFSCGGVSAKDRGEQPLNPIYNIYISPLASGSFFSLFSLSLKRIPEIVFFIRHNFFGSSCLIFHLGGTHAESGNEQREWTVDASRNIKKEKKREFAVSILM